MHREIKLDWDVQADESGFLFIKVAFNGWKTLCVFGVSVG
jgi:hypothetical protein